jgi:hypothetical protein
MAAEQSSETNWCTRRISSDDSIDHDIPDWTIRSWQDETSHTIDEVKFEYNSYESFEHDHHLEMLLWMERSYP